MPVLIKIIGEISQNNTQCATLHAYLNVFMHHGRGGEKNAIKERREEHVQQSCKNIHRASFPQVPQSGVGVDNGDKN